MQAHRYCGSFRPKKLPAKRLDSEKLLQRFALQLHRGRIVRDHGLGVPAQGTNDVRARDPLSDRVYRQSAPEDVADILHLAFETSPLHQAVQVATKAVIADALPFPSPLYR